MKKFFTFIRNKHNLIFKVFLFVLAVACIVFIFPNKAKFKYEFQKGKPWAHEDLIAPFDYAVHKTDKELSEERESALKSHKPYFYKSNSVKEQALKELEDNFENSWMKAKEKDVDEKLNNKSLYKKWAVDFLNSIYNKGIIELHASIEDGGRDQEVLLLTGNTATTVEIKQLYTIQEAYEHLNQSVKRFNKNEQELLLDLVKDLLNQNISYDKQTNDLMLKEVLEKVSPTKGLVQKGERLISKGELLNEDKFQLVESFKIEYESKTGANQSSLILIGQIVLVSLMLFALGLYLVTLRMDVIRSDTKIVFLLSLIILFVYASKAAITIDNLDLYLVPFCMIPLLIRTFFNIRLALFTYIMTILIIGFIAPNPYEFIILQTITGIITLFSILNLRNRAQLFLSSLIIFVTYSVVYLSIGLIQEGSFTNTNWVFLGWFIGSAMFTLFTYPLVYAFEKIFGFVSDVSLMELSDTNSKLLRKLNMKAPGTFQHSLQVSNLADEAIRAIGGNSLLVRTGALYHDIGKMHNPNYFIENQNSDYNPHDELSPKESASMIIEHVTKGIEIARRYKLPDIIIDFIRTHHGTSLTLYFYRMYKEQNPESEIDESAFRYPGPIPYSKETAVLMMADSVEAASRSLPSYDRESIEKLVDGIINRQINEEQFVTADITFKDITTIKKILKKKLMSIYHVRVEYPEDKS